jgi:RNA polymerase sigma-70 factor (ECF subfamily)
MAHRDDEKLIRRIRRTGSERDKERLILAYYDEIFVYAFRQTQDRELALDLTQEAFIAAIRGIESYDSGKASFRTWLYRIATNKVIDYRRGAVARRERAVPLPEDTGAEAEVALDEIVEGLRIAEAVDEKLMGYPPAVQEIFRLRVYGEYGFSEIARVTDRPEASVKTTYYRLIHRLRKELGER